MDLCEIQETINKDFRKFRCRKDGRFLFAENIKEGRIIAKCPICKTFYILTFQDFKVKIEEVPLDKK